MRFGMAYDVLGGAGRDGEGTINVAPEADDCEELRACIVGRSVSVGTDIGGGG